MSAFPGTQPRGRSSAGAPSLALSLVFDDRTLLVQKFGGTSVADPDRIRQVADHVARTRRHGDDVVVVVSAMGKETDELIRLASEVATVRPGREMDMLITAGERKATALLCMALHDIGVAGGVVHGQPGRVRHGHQPHERAHPRDPTRSGA